MRPSTRAAARERMISIVAVVLVRGCSREAHQYSEVRLFAVDV
jgi:hypothetical protein